MINIPNNNQPVEDNGMIKPEWNTFFQQIKTVIKNDYAQNIGLPNALQPIIDENKNIDRIWYNFFEKSYKTTGAFFGIPSSQEKLSSKWHTFFENMYQELK
jgi:hypothetical protein